jgi:hypothetical protein
MPKIKLFQIVAIVCPLLVAACSHSDGNGVTSPGTSAFARKIACLHVDPTAIDPADFVAGVDNLYFPLPQGAHWTWRGETDEGEEITDDTVTGTKVILGVTTTVVHDVVTVDGSKIEETFDWYAQDKDGNVWYFGEDSSQWEDGTLVGTEGSWEAGKDGALAGIIMLACPKMGNTYKQEYLAGVAEDVGRVAGLDKTATVPLGTFDDCLKTLDTSLLDPGADEYKYYAPGIGLVLEVEKKSGVRAELISATGLDD